MCCPHCGTNGVVRIDVTRAGQGLVFSRCTRGCERHWWEDGAGHPERMEAVFERARSVPARSPRAAAVA